MSQSAEPMRPFDLSRSANWKRVDESDDGNFYQDPRLVVHVDDHFIATLSRFYGQTLPSGAVILDLMSSYKSHLPADYQPGKVVGLGMNEAELKANRQLNEYTVQNLNQNPTLPYAAASFDAVLNTVSVQYLRRPIEVFREVGRVLKPGGLHILSFSNRMFPTKAVQIWRELGEPERVALVQQYFAESGTFEPPQVFTDVASRQAGNKLWASLFNTQDPVYIVWGAKKK